ncbi:hypothetical protein [Roseateles puraquae]|uniref:hypothetical protein n=1 Tax=Roseateles puraquae TaxID=431059 RepID=UPI0031D70FC5
MMPPVWLLKLGLLAFVVAMAAGYGYRHGAAKVQARWDKAAAEQQAQADAERESNRLRAQAAATSYEAQRATRAREAATPSPEVRNALNASICPSLGASAPALRLGDVLVGAPVVDRLRRAGTDY